MGYCNALEKLIEKFRNDGKKNIIFNRLILPLFQVKRVLFGLMCLIKRQFFAITFCRNGCRRPFCVVCTVL